MRQFLLVWASIYSFARPGVHGIPFAGKTFDVTLGVSAISFVLGLVVFFVTRESRGAALLDAEERQDGD